MLLFPILQFIFLIYMVVAPGTADTNRFGAVPAPADFGVKLGAALGCMLVAALQRSAFFDIEVAVQQGAGQVLRRDVDQVA